MLVLGYGPGLQIDGSMNRRLKLTIKLGAAAERSLLQHKRCINPEALIRIS